MTMGKVEEAKIYYRRLLEGLEPTKHSDLVRCYETLGLVADETRDYDASLELYEKSLKTNMATLDKQPLDIPSNYNSIQLAKQVVCYNNIGFLNREQQKYKEPLDFYQKAYDIHKEMFSIDETSLGMSNNNICNAYYFLDLYDDALYYYQEALKIYKKNSSSATSRICIDL
jgi:tetratricopeptide (TPR) repeat protein